MDTTILSIDPGAKGFLSVLEINSQITPIECIPIPVCKVKINKKNRTKIDEDSLSKIIHKLIDKYNVTEIVIEEQRVQAGQGLTSTGSTMHHFGWLKGFCYGKQVNKTIVPPKEWQDIYPTLIPIDAKLLQVIKDFNKTKDRLKNPLLERLGDFPTSLLEPKEKSKLYCSALFPDLDLRRTTRCTDISDGKTDSLLIGVWKSRQLRLDNKLTA
jgi:hypothetical protein